MAVQIEVTLTAAEWGEEPQFTGVIELADSALPGRARFEFCAVREPADEDVMYTFTRLRRPSRVETFSALGPCQERAYVLFAAALHAAVGAVESRDLKDRLAPPPSFGLSGEVEAVGEQSIRVRFSLDSEVPGVGIVVASLLGAESWFGTLPAALA